MNANVLQSSLTPLRDALEDVEAERDRLNRRIRRLREAIRSVELGVDVPQLEELLQGASPSARPAPPTLVQQDTPPQPQLAPPPQLSPLAPMPGMGFLTRMGEGLPAGVASGFPVPPSQQFGMPSVDVGVLGRMTPELLDSLPFGVVTLDANGRVVGYNDTESRMAGLPRDMVIGRNFFTDVAPCARVREFEGRFRDFASGRSRLALETFEFVFHFRAGAQRVVILISPARLRGQFHVSMIRP